MGNASKPIITQPQQISGPMLLGNDRLPLIVVVEDGHNLSEAIYPVCEFLNINIKRVHSNDDLAPMLEELRPMAVMADVDAEGQDGYHVMKTVGSYDPTLPILLLTGGDPAFAGAADAIEEVWGLSAVVKRPTLPCLGEFVEFLFHAGQQGRCLGLLPV